MEIIIATGNDHKVLEFRRMLEPLGYRVFSQKDKGVRLDAEETGGTFGENAAIKATALWEVLHLPVIADDSGLCCDALDGRPGIYSARYAGSDATDGERIEKLLGELSGKEDRSARFVCAVAYIDSDGSLHLFEETCEGTIAMEAMGADGFGYDPIFLVGNKTFAEMTAEEKDAVSHRGKANRALEAFLHLQK